MTMSFDIVSLRQEIALLEKESFRNTKQGCWEATVESYQHFYLSTSGTLLFSSSVELQRVQLIPMGANSKAPGMGGLEKLRQGLL